METRMLLFCNAYPSLFARAIHAGCLLLLAGCLCLLAGCRGDKPAATPPAMAFYHWKTVFNPTQAEHDLLQAAGVTRLYMRVFDVVQQEGKTVPVATVIFKQKPALPVTPVVFITTESLPFAPVDTAALAERIVRRMLAVVQGNALPITQELQLDCDWTLSTKDRFFALVEAVKQQLPQSWQVSSTLRLYQYRYPEQAGVPPAHRAILMLYNMSDLRTMGSTNSILDAKVAQSYLAGAKPYPLPMDVALPLFSWGVLFDASNDYRGLLRTLPPELLEAENGTAPLPVEDPVWQKEATHQYRLKIDYTFAGQRLPAGWLVRVERTHEENLEALVQVVKQYVAAENSLIFYHLDTNTPQDWPAAVLRRVYGVMTEGK